MTAETFAMAVDSPATGGERRDRRLGSTPATMVVDLEAVAANFAEVCHRLAPPRRAIAVLKADGYGHGAAAVARRLERAGADLLAVGCLDDAAAMRAAGVAAPVVLLSALQPDMIGDVLALDLIPTVEDVDGAAALAAAVRQPVEVFVKVDSGFGRFGIPLAAAAGLVRAVAALLPLRIGGLYTHLPFSDAPGRDWAEQRLAAFTEMVEALAREGTKPGVTQALASAGLYLGLPDRLSAVATGSILFGLPPVSAALEPASAGWRLRPALSAITTRLVHVGHRPPGVEAAAYLRRTAGPVGVIPIGIRHGYRPVAPEAFVIVGGVAAPVLRACLENTVIDISAVRGATVGSDVMVLGAAADLRIGIDELAAWQGISVLAALTGLGRSLDRRYGDVQARSSR